METKRTPEPGSFVKYAGAAYEVVDIVDFAGCLFVRIYDEPPSKHIDEIKLSSVELITVPDLLAKVSEHEKEIHELEEILAGAMGGYTKKELEQSQRIQQLEGLLREALPLLSYTGYNGIAKKIEAILKSST